MDDSRSETPFGNAHFPEAACIAGLPIPRGARFAARMLELKDVVVNYGSISALHGISLKVERGSIVTLVGANGAGKSTTLRTISGVVKAASGSIVFDGEEITDLPAHRIVGRGIAQSPEGRMIFANLSVMENLLMGAYLRKDRQNFAKLFGEDPRAAGFI